MTRKQLEHRIRSTTEALRKEHIRNVEKQGRVGKCNVLMCSIGMNLLSLAFSTPGEPVQESLLRRIAAQMNNLHDLEREAAYISGFHAAVEMTTKEGQNNAA